MSGAWLARGPATLSTSTRWSINQRRQPRPAHIDDPVGAAEGGGAGDGKERAAGSGRAVRQHERRIGIGDVPPRPLGIAGRARLRERVERRDRTILGEPAFGAPAAAVEAQPERGAVAPGLPAGDDPPQAKTGRPPAPRQPTFAGGAPFLFEPALVAQDGRRPCRVAHRPQLTSRALPRRAARANGID